MKKVSVILPTYNSERTLGMTLDSVLRQDRNGSEFRIELIVVDDCSTDGTQDILRQRNIPFVTTTRNTGGPNRGRNMGLEMATGDFICFIDHDDLWEPEKISSQLQAADFAPIITTGYSVWRKATGRWTEHSRRTPELRMYKPNETFYKILTRSKAGQISYLSTIMISRELKHITFEEEYGKLDYDWDLRLYENRSSVEIPISLMTRVVGGHNLSLNAVYREAYYRFVREVLQGYRSSYPAEVSLAERRLNGSLARFYYLRGEMAKARHFLRMSPFGLKELLYYLTSFSLKGSSVVRKQFTVFG